MLKSPRSTTSKIASILLLATSLVFVATTPAVASDVTESHQGCDMTAYQVTKSGGQATASGNVFCAVRHVLVMKVTLQINVAGSWNNVKSASASGRGVVGLNKWVTANCSKFAHDYRTLISVSVDGGQNWPVKSSSPYTACMAG